MRVDGWSRDRRRSQGHPGPPAAIAFRMPSSLLTVSTRSVPARVNWPARSLSPPEQFPEQLLDLALPGPERAPACRREPVDPADPAALPLLRGAQIALGFQRVEDGVQGPRAEPVAVMREFLRSSTVRRWGARRRGAGYGGESGQYSPRADLRVFPRGSVGGLAPRDNTHSASGMEEQSSAPTGLPSACHANSIGPR